MKRFLGIAMLALMALGFVGTASAAPYYYGHRVAAARFAAREAFLNRRIHEHDALRFQGGCQRQCLFGITGR